jgi:hypothetical protein
LKITLWTSAALVVLLARLCTGPFLFPEPDEDEQASFQYPRPAPEVRHAVITTGTSFSRLDVPWRLPWRGPGDVLPHRRQPCLHYAAATMQDGIWGGTTAEERRVLRRIAAPLLNARARGERETSMVS